MARRDGYGGNINPASRGAGNKGARGAAGPPAPGIGQDKTSLGTRGGPVKAKNFDPNARAPKNFRGEKEPKARALARSRVGAGGNLPSREGSRGFAVQGIKGFGDFEMSHTSKTR